ncbi:NUDIX hydrolase [Luedemannella helvata]|uniref:NUDIX hydrolase n=1 Tax=Luedemannella helvata TaxID=349315 RepID=UPI003CD0A881
MTSPALNLPAWWDPLAARALDARRADFTRWSTPAVGGRPSAVLVLLGESDGEPDVLILQRAARMRSHAGQPAFPGGGAEPGDADAVATALREANEEVGLQPPSVTVVATLPRLWIPVSGFVVTPVLAWWHAPHPVAVMQPEEVARVERIPIAELLDPANRGRVKHPSGFVGPAFAVRSMVVWGFTAGILDTLFELAGWTRPWRPGRLIPLAE